jgi:hypothetical protein
MIAAQSYAVLISVHGIQTGRANNLHRQTIGCASLIQLKHDMESAEYPDCLVSRLAEAPVHKLR